MTLSPYWHKKTGKFRYSVTMWNAKQQKTARLGHYDSIEDAKAAEVAYRAENPLRHPHGGRVALEGTHYIIDTETGCWEWMRKKTPLGYGYWRSPITGRQEPAHRCVYEMQRGPIPEGLQLDHLCRNKGCVNPDHLEPVTPRENIHRYWRWRRATENASGELTSQPT